MSEARRSGKAALLPVDGKTAAGAVAYSMDSKGVALNVTTRLAAGKALMAVLQHGPEQGYSCLNPMGTGGTIKVDDSAIAAVWIVEGGKPVLFGRLQAGVFDMTLAKAQLDKSLQASVGPEYQQTRASKPAAAIPATDAAPNLSQQGGGAVQSTFRGREWVLDKPANQQPDRAQRAGEAVQPFRTDEQSPQIGRPPPAQASKPALAALIDAFKPAVTPKAAGITVKRAEPVPMPTHTPLWEDISPEVEKLLDTLPASQPFAGTVQSARFAKLPYGNTLQCYVGSVIVGGAKVSLQAVPARPYGRPAGFDHTLVSREVDCFWVRYEVEAAQDPAVGAPTSDAAPMLP